MAEMRIKKPGSIDWTIFYLIALLLMVGVTMIFSASFVQAKFKHQDALFFLKKEVLWASVGFIGMYITSKIDYRWYKKFALPLMILNIILLAFTLTQEPINGSRRWIQMGTSFQTSELTKYACILMSATIISNRKNKIRELGTVLQPLIYVGISVLLIMLQTDTSTAMTIIFVALGMLFISGANLGYILAMAAMGVPLILIKIMNKTGYQMGRIQAFLDPFQYSSDKGYQVIQSIYALASGGITGLGLGKSRQKFFYLPEPQNDFIFAIIGEELGYIGAIFVLILFTLLIGKCMTLVFKCPDMFSSMLVAGITLQLGIQVLLNVGVATSSLPNTGIALPLVSYGGTSLVITMMALGLLLNISRYAKK